MSKEKLLIAFFFTASLEKIILYTRNQPVGQSRFSNFPDLIQLTVSIIVKKDSHTM